MNLDPENQVYDKLALNRGWDSMIRPATAFRFKDRIFGSGQSLDSLFEVLGKWKDGKLHILYRKRIICRMHQLISHDIVLVSCLHTAEARTIN